MNLLPFSAQTAMYTVGAVEILAAVMVAIKPRYASYVVAPWLAGPCGSPPAPKLHTGTTWRQFLRAQAGPMLAADFFHPDCTVPHRYARCPKASPT